MLKYNYKLDGLPMSVLSKIVLFGEAERGDYFNYHLCSTIPQLMEMFGQPPPMSKGIFYAIQALHYNCELLFFRVKEEGYSYQDYFRGLKILGQQGSRILPNALCAPGVGDASILDAMRPVCIKYHCILIANEADLYDFLMASKGSAC